MWTNRLVLLGLALLGLGCRAPEVLPFPPGRVGELSIGLASPSPALHGAAKNILPLDPGHTVIYSQDSGGGGVLLELAAGGVGILAGGGLAMAFPPMGMGANYLLVSRTTRREGASLREHVHVEPGALFTRAAQRVGMELEQTPMAHIRAIPFLWLRKADSRGGLALFAGLVLEPNSDQASWRCRYLCQVPVELTQARLAKATPGDWEAWAPAIEEGFGAILRFSRSDPVEAGGVRTRVKVSQALVPPHLPFRRDPELMGKDERRIWVKRPEATYGLLQTPPVEVRPSEEMVQSVK
jgi:hypothetical protein